MLNEVNICGRLTATPELKYTASGTAVTSFSVAVDRNTADKQTDFLNFVAWRSTAEFICKHFQKGKMIIINGSLQSRSYTTQDGEKRHISEVVVKQAYFAGDKHKTPDSGAEAVATGDFTEIEEENGELPF